MSRKVLAAAAVLLVTVTFAAVPAGAQGNQSLSLNLGYFALRGEDARVPGDVLVENLNYLSFWPRDLNNVTFGGEWLVGLGDYMEVGAGVGFYAKSVPSVYTDYVNSDGSEIMQRLKLQIVPVTATIRFLPLRRGAGIEPYFGAGIGIYNWRYSETGEFMDADYFVFRNRYIASGTNFGPVVLGGVRFPMGPSLGLGGEIRYQRGEGDLGADFYGDRIDLGGVTYQMTFQVKF
jgi:hypothetical protein